MVTMTRTPTPETAMNPARGAYAVTPGNVDLPIPAKSLYVGASGDVVVVPIADQTEVPTQVTFKSVPVGELRIQCRRVISGSNIVALYD